MRARELSFGQKLLNLNWGLLLLVCMLAGIGAAMLYSAADGSMDPWASRHLMRFAAGLLLMFAAALVDIRLWLRYAYLLYFGAFSLLVAVEVAGEIGMGAQRWIDLGVFQLQPSELMKIGLVLALARYFHQISADDVGRIRYVILPTMLVLAPAGLVLKQPDLGTAGMLLLTAGAMFFTAGVRIWKFALVGVAALAALPVVWTSLHGYQKQRILTFLDPSSDPLGAGYHITQSQIALGSGGIFGKGFMLGTQSQLNFLPEKQTDFIFTMLGEELGLMGGLAVLGLYTLVLLYGYLIAFNSTSHFGRMLAIGVSVNLFLYVFINIAMVMGMIPVVGVPLPLISYGGTAMLTVLLSIGLLINVYVHRDIELPRSHSLFGD
jgi:rod shape determining protein RodA